MPGRLLILGAFCCGAALSATPALVDVYRGGEGGYAAYRIPAMVTTSKGTLLAFCEGRKNSASDSGDIDIVLRRSFDNGRTWSRAQVVADRGGDTIGNPAPVVERKTGTIFLLLTSNPGDATERQITNGSAPAGRTVWIARSTDEGALDRAGRDHRAGEASRLDVVRDRSGQWDSIAERAPGGPVRSCPPRWE